MKKCLVVLLSFLLLFSVALAEDPFWTCASCNASNANVAFCIQCGAKRVTVCGDCGWDAGDSAANYCGSCGAKMMSDPQYGIEIGDVVLFGHYEQDNNSSNGKESIRWVVMNKQDGKALLLSVDILDAQPYDARGTSAGWEGCTLREWLNTTFYANAFDSQEAGLVRSYRTGNRTEDKVYVLSYESGSDLHGYGMGSVFIADNHLNPEYSTYYKTGVENFEFALATDYALSQNHKAEEYYWERDGSCKNNDVSGDGCFYAKDSETVQGVRPACWVSLSAFEK